MSDEPQYVIVHPHEHEEYTLAARIWDFLIGTAIFLVIAAVVGWFAHLIWNSLELGPDVSFLNAVGILVLIRFAGLFFAYDRS
jgi:hypothetical protein